MMQQIGLGQQDYSLRNEPRVGWRTGAGVVLGTMLVALCAHIAIPLGFTPVPATMQTFAVLLLSLVLGPAAAFSCLALYLAEGLMGLPVFSPHGPGGLAQLLGPTGGYLLSYPFAAAMGSWLYRQRRGGFLKAAASAAVASLLILAAGATWMGILTHAKLSLLFLQSVAPFLPGDAVKILLAAGCANMLTSFGRNRLEQTL